MFDSVEGIEKIASDVQPTEKGIEKYPPSGFYDQTPCICTNNCPPNCKGECGCEACLYSYSDQLDTRFS